jgi:hypothetical protein
MNLNLSRIEIRLVATFLSAIRLDVPALMRITLTLTSMNLLDTYAAR